MASAYATVPFESDWLCEACGYVLNGLPEHGRCPECGAPVSDSASHWRVLPSWERPHAGRASVARFLQTSLEVIIHPGHFYRTLVTRDSRSLSRRFARIYLLGSSILFGTAAYLHLMWFDRLSIWEAPRFLTWWIGLPALALVTYLALAGITRLAARLTSYEAAYRGIRLPLPVVLRGLDYHAAHYLPVALVAAGTVIGNYLYALRAPSAAMLHANVYLYLLCGEVVIGAFYLFRTYWIGMKNMMYASR